RRPRHRPDHHSTRTDRVRADWTRTDRPRTPGPHHHPPGDPTPTTRHQRAAPTRRALRHRPIEPPHAPPTTRAQDRTPTRPLERPRPTTLLTSPPHHTSPAATAIAPGCRCGPGCDARRQWSGLP